MQDILAVAWGKIQWGDAKTAHKTAAKRTAQCARNNRHIYTHNAKIDLGGSDTNSTASPDNAQ